MSQIQRLRQGYLEAAHSHNSGMLVNFRLQLILVSSLLLTASISLAQVTPVTLLTDGTDSNTTTAAGPAVFIATSKGNLTDYHELSVRAPKESVITVEAAKLQNSVEETLANPTLWWSVYLNKNGFDPAKSLTVGDAALSPAANGDPECGLTTEQMAYYIVINYLSTGVKISAEEVCARYGINSESPTVGTGISQAEGTLLLTSFTLNKDNCLSKKTTYLVKLTITPPTSLTTAYSTTAAMKSYKYSGARHTSLKPKSEGKYHPNPIMLMRALSGPGYMLGRGSGRVLIYSWKGGKPKQISSTKTGDYTFWRGLLLTRTPLSTSVLKKGGKATFELNNGRDMYGVCLELKRKRQKANGYP